MQSTTVQIARSAFIGDPTIDPRTRARLLALIRAGGQEAEPKPPALPTEPRIVRRAETAKRFGRSLRWVDALAKAGILSKVKLPGRNRACGFRESDIVALIQGGGQ